MFLHSGASLHGHEYSSRPVPHPGQRRNALLRSAFATPINRTSSYRTSIESSDEPASPKPRRIRPLSEHIPKTNVLEPVVRFEEPRCEPATPKPKPEAMSEDEGSIASDSDASRVSSSARRARRRAPRKSTTFLLAHPPPKLRSKQRLIHIRPTLLLQIQHLSANQRPRPAIDVYPSSAIARSLIAPLLKRFPRIAHIKRDLCIQDVMLVKSEDYAAQASGPESDGDEDDLRSRDLLAILSPLRTEDKAEIVLADGTVWFATPRFNGTNLWSYEFVSVDLDGNTTTARWVRKQIATKSLPTTPTSNFPTQPTPSTTDYKFTFSIIDPNCRRHPIMATLTTSSLDILDTYTTVSQSASRYPPTSPMLSRPASPTGAEPPLERTTQQVEDWQKNFIAISAIWVILRHGWSPNCKPSDFGPLSAFSPTSPTDAGVANRNRSLSTNSEMTSKFGIQETANRRKLSGTLRMSDQFVPGLIPRRATSTGAAFMQKRNASEMGSVDQTSGSPEQTFKLNRRAFSGDWGIIKANRSVENSIAAVVDASPASPLAEDPIQSNTSSPVPPPIPPGRRAVSAYYSVDPMSLKSGDVELCEKPNIERNPVVQITARGVQMDDQDRKAKHQKWRSMANWFRKLQGR
ncbi:hypothetical protein F4820DRAFT_97058 [Hypoxylon rubiginosum]|uniref:Uncharacterized protein n=1 Tax=Hypoxylon rubiginosum TaxID=110542 RepID=A0ACB9YNW8_9PEZI|nr:hypothetical protein F4820DRAFT_97058 [Hypoxylon rubiginosum]